MEKSANSHKSPSSDHDSPSSSRKSSEANLSKPSPTKVIDLTPVKETNSPKEMLKRTQTGELQHCVPFKKKELEKRSGPDHKPSSDNLFDLRHSKVYEEQFEKQHVANYMPMEAVNRLSEPLTAKIIDKKRIRSNSDEDLLSIKPKKGEGKKRRHSINKKLLKGQSNLLEAEVQIKGSGLIYEQPDIPVDFEVFDSKTIIA